MLSKYNAKSTEYNYFHKISQFVGGKSFIFCLIYFTSLSLKCLLKNIVFVFLKFSDFLKKNLWEILYLIVITHF